MMRGQRLPAKTVEKIKRDLLGGVSVSDTANRNKVSVTTVKRYEKDLALKQRSVLAMMNRREA